jgi:hypothetical protein
MRAGHNHRGSEIGRQLVQKVATIYLAETIVTDTRRWHWKPPVTVPAIATDPD